MRPLITPEQIAEMKARGYDSETLREARELLEAQVPVDELCRRIEEAFAGVTLGNGVGLSEANALDDYEDEATCALRRLDDEKEDWRRITWKQLNRFSSSPSFFDAEGMRFHLPALLIADLKGEYNQGMEFNLAHRSDHSREQFSLLNEAQREVVRDYLHFLLTHPDSKFHREDITDALLGYWAESAPESTRLSS
ncbi:MAG: hypothetical protein JWO82_3785 [Akkermansiaceae bacterium]|nr:hypothetical protein [Akkermansiaceae bacterium]